MSELTAHPHHHGPLEAITHVHGGPMVVDIGGSVGALHVRLDESWSGRELYLATDDPAFSVHTGVWVRHVAGCQVASALFAELDAGRYRILRDGAVLATAHVNGGELTELDLSDVSAAAPAGTAR